MATKKKTEEPKKITATVIGDYPLNVRSTKDKGNNIIGQLDPGAEVEVLDKGEQWCEIGKGKYVMTEFLHF